MERATKQFGAGWERKGGQANGEAVTAILARTLLRTVDGGLAAIICVAPFFFGGRHDYGRLVLLILIALVSVAWFARQALFSAAAWHRTRMHVIFACAAFWLLFQITPLPSHWIARLAPRNVELLPMWTPSDLPAEDDYRFGAWRTLSLSPHETAKALAMLMAYGLLFVVVAQRISELTDVRRLLTWIGLASVLMAGFGLVQYFTSDGRFFWFYDHPFRTTDQYVTGSFINRNHFASFLVLGIGPLMAMLLAVVHDGRGTSHRANVAVTRRVSFAVAALSAALALVVFAVLCSLSRGGAIVLFVASIVFSGICFYRRVLDARYVFGIGVFGVVMVGLLSCCGYDRVAQRLDDFATGSMESIDHDEGRRKIWSANVEAFRAAWFAGAGAGSHRVVYPIYLPETHSREYTHAENGYLQIATETGLFGLVLLSGAMFACSSWCLACLRLVSTPRAVLCFAACASGLVASACHSVFDFVWYIPACITTAVILAACTLRLAQFARNDAVDSAEVQSRNSFSLRRPRWIEMTFAVMLLGAWCVYSYVGPAVAAVHWDRYLNASVADREIAQHQFAEFASGNVVPSAAASRKELSRLMLQELRHVITWDPSHAEAHARLADRLMAEFEMRTVQGDNAMDVTQLRDAALRSKFASPQALRAWLARAFGDDSTLLFEACEHARRAVALCPLQGEAYLYLADLCFSDQLPPTAVKAYVDQGLTVRPYDKNVLFRAGRQALFLGEPDKALEHWSRCFHVPGAHQQQIIYRLVASGMPAAEFIHRFQPEWPGLRDVWTNYRAHGGDDDLAALLKYSSRVSERQANRDDTIRPESIWFWQAMMYSDAGQEVEAVACLERAHSANPRQFYIRWALQKALIATGRYAEAEPHVRWCLARRPADKMLHQALKAISRHRLEERAAIAGHTHQSIWR